MATKFFLKSASRTTTSLLCASRTRLALDLAAGTSLATDSMATLAGPVDACTQITDMDDASSVVIYWISNPLNAVTISGTITMNFWMSESAMAANAGAAVGIVSATNAGVLQTKILGTLCTGTCVGSGWLITTELPVTTRAAQNWTATPASVSIADGERIAIGVRIDDVGGTMASGNTVDLGYNGGTGGADGDSWVQFTETITEQVPGALVVIAREIAA